MAYYLTEHSSSPFHGHAACNHEKPHPQSPKR